MTGWRIFVHSVQLVLRNLSSALRVSLVLYAVQAAAQVAFFLSVTENAGTLQPSLPVVLLSILGVVASLWIAVAWHRFVLAEEYPAGWLPRWHGGSILLYFWRSLLIGLLVVALVVAVGVVLALALGTTGIGIVLVPLLATTAAAVLFFRLSPWLPAAALDRPMDLPDAWSRTAGRTGDLLVLALITGIFTTLLELPGLLGGGASLFGLVYGLVLGWIGTMVGASILTTIYGITVEGRAID